MTSASACCLIGAMLLAACLLLTLLPRLRAAHQRLLHQWLLRRVRVRVVVLGLPNAGKSTIALQLIEGKLSQPYPHLHPHSGLIDEEACLLTVHPCSRPFAGSGPHINTYTPSLREAAAASDGVIFVIDANNRAQIGAVAALYDVALRGLTVPRLLILNKSDCTGCMAPSDAIASRDGEPQPPFQCARGESDREAWQRMRACKVETGDDDPASITIIAGSAISRRCVDSNVASVVHQTRRWIASCQRSHTG